MSATETQQIANTVAAAMSGAPATPAVETTADKATAFKFSNFTELGLMEESAKYFAEQLQSLPPEQQQKHTANESAVRMFLNHELENTIKTTRTLKEFEKKYHQETVEQQLAFVKELEGKAETAYGDKAKDVMAALSEAAKTPNSNFKTLRMFAEAAITKPSLNKQPASNIERVSKAASADPGEQQAKRTWLPTPNDDNSADQSGLAGLSILWSTMNKY